MKRKASTVESIENSGINTIFANIMQVKTKTKYSTNINPLNIIQDVERKASLTPKGPPPNIYSCNQIDKM